MTANDRSKNILWIIALCAIAVFAISSRGCGYGYGPWTGDHFTVFGAVTRLFGLWWVLSAGLAIWVGVDANRRGNNGWLWGGLTFLTGLVGLLVYLLLEKDIKIARRGVDDQPIADAPQEVTVPTSETEGTIICCGACGATLRSDFRHCPYCGRSCEERRCSCGRELQPDWKACPDCGNPAT